MPSFPLELAPAAAFVVFALAVFGLGSRLLRRGSVPGPRLVLGPFTEAFAGLTPLAEAPAQALDLELRRAGYYRPKARAEYLAVRNLALAAWILLVIAALWYAVEPGSFSERALIIGGIVGAILLYALPRFLLRGQANARMRRIELALPDALDMMTMCLAGGLPLRDAFDRVSCELQSSHPDLALELEIVRRQADAGTMQQALEELSRRLDVADVNSLTALVTQTDRLGANVASSLRDYADSVRRSHRQRAEERGNKSTVKLILPIAFCLAPPIYVLLLGPALLEMRSFITKETQPGGALAQTVPRSRRSDPAYLNRATARSEASPAQSPQGEPAAPSAVEPSRPARPRSRIREYIAPRDATESTPAPATSPRRNPTTRSALPAGTSAP